MTPSFVKCSNGKHVRSAMLVNVGEVSDSSQFICSDCLTEKQYNFERLVNISSCIRATSSNDNVINNWPPGFSMSIANKLRDIAQPNRKVNLLARTNLAFDDLKKQMNDALEKARSESITDIEGTTDCFDAIMGAYNEVSRREQLEAILSKVDEHTEASFKAFLGEMLAS